MSYTIKYNRSTNHIAGIECKDQSTGEEKGGVVRDYAQNACNSLTRYALATGKSYEDISIALAAARIAGRRRLCKNCEKAATALVEAEVAAEELAQAEAAKPVADAEHQVGDVLYFIPSRDRKAPSYIPAGPVHVIRVVDHVQATMYSPRFTYVVQVPGVQAATQGTDARELYAAGSVPQDYRFWETYTNAVCQEQDCRKDVSYANSKIVREPIVRPAGQPVYPGMITAVERRVCAHH
jgi:hypothetical protein